MLIVPLVSCSFEMGERGLLLKAIVVASWSARFLFYIDEYRESRY